MNVSRSASMSHVSYGWFVSHIQRILLQAPRHHTCTLSANTPYAWVTSHMNESCCMTESCPICISLSCALSACPYRICMSHVLCEWVTSHMNESCHAYEWVVSHMHQSLVCSQCVPISYMDESRLICMSHVPYERVMSRIWMSNVTHMNA